MMTRYDVCPDSGWPCVTVLRLFRHIALLLQRRAVIFLGMARIKAGFAHTSPVCCRSLAVYFFQLLHNTGQYAEKRPKLQGAGVGGDIFPVDPAADTSLPYFARLNVCVAYTNSAMRSLVPVGSENPTSATAACQVFQSGS